MRNIKDELYKQTCFVACTVGLEAVTCPGAKRNGYGMAYDSRSISIQAQLAAKA